MRKIMIAGAKSGVGKTMVSTAIMASFDDVAPFKIGPDYIDPGFHRIATQSLSYNLDNFMLDETMVKFLFQQGAKGKNIAIIEGVMGLYDGIDNSLDNNGTAHLSRVLDVPVILIVNGNKASTSLAAEILGFKLFDTRVKIVGIILNNVNNEKSYERLKEAIENYAKIECLGYFPYKENLSVKERHLGLTQAEELDEITIKIEELKNHAKTYLNLDRIYDLADSFALEDISYKAEYLKDSLKRKRIAIAKDKAFSFYYQSNIDLLNFCGAELVFFSPIFDEELPKDIDFLYLGGGYPENFAKELSENITMIKSLESFAQKGRIYAECGGFIYLTKGIKNLNGEFYNFCNVFDIDIAMRKSLDLQRFGYIDIELNNGIKTRGHEFHYSEIIRNNEDNQIYKVKKADGRNWNCGYLKNKVLGAYAHVDFHSDLSFFEYLFLE